MATLLLAGFSGSMLLIGSALGPYWMALDATAYRTSFQALGPPLGSAMIPLMAGSILLSALIASLSPERRRPWAVACGLLLLIVPLYALVHAPVNEALLGSKPLEGADIALLRTRWLFWHGVRTIAGFVALAIATRR